MEAKDQDLDLHSLCNRILESDRSIRFVGIPNKWANKSYHRTESWTCSITNTMGNRKSRYKVRIEDEYKKRF
jgi:hypothetical protein